MLQIGCVRGMPTKFVDECSRCVSLKSMLVHNAADMHPWQGLVRPPPSLVPQRLDAKERRLRDAEAVMAERERDLALRSGELAAAVNVSTTGRRIPHLSHNWTHAVHAQSCPLPP